MLAPNTGPKSPRRRCLPLAQQLPAFLIAEAVGDPQSYPYCDLAGYSSEGSAGAGVPSPAAGCAAFCRLRAAITSAYRAEPGARCGGARNSQRQAAEGDLRSPKTDRRNPAGQALNSAIFYDGPLVIHDLPTLGRSPPEGRPASDASALDPRV